MASPKPRTDAARIAELERQVALLAGWAVECRNLALLAWVAADICHRGLLEGREAFAEAEVSASELLGEAGAQFAKNVRERMGKDVDLARPERIPTRRAR